MSEIENILPTNLDSASTKEKKAFFQEKPNCIGQKLISIYNKGRLWD